MQGIKAYLSGGGLVHAPKLRAFCFFGSVTGLLLLLINAILLGEDSSKCKTLKKDNKSVEHCMISKQSHGYWQLSNIILGIVATGVVVSLIVRLAVVARNRSAILRVPATPERTWIVVMVTLLFSGLVVWNTINSVALPGQCGDQSSQSCSYSCWSALLIFLLDLAVLVALGYGVTKGSPLAASPEDKVEE
jgi:hypothetical protein